VSNSTSQNLERVVSDNTEIDEKIDLLNTQIFPDLVEYFNSGEASDRLTRLTKDIEPVPDHSRNVTEIRTRVGLLLEFNLGIVIEEYLPEDHVVSYGASQAHTDLVLRGADRKPTIRLEVKAIEDIAEEKAASYEDMVHSIDPRKDILAIFVWGWRPDYTNGTETRIPQLYDLRAFEMKEISMARDLFWMQNPNSGNKNMIDISMPVIQRTPGELKEEEGNMGKLTRIVDSGDLEDNPELKSQLNFDELRRYINYMSFCKGVGISRAAEYYMDEQGYSYTSRDDPLYYDTKDCQFVNTGESKNDKPILIFSAGSRVIYTMPEFISSIDEAIYSQMDKRNISEANILVIDNEKFDWTYATAKLTGFDAVSSLETTIVERGDNLFGDKIGRTPI
jgi:hypothetical protein